MSILNGQSVVTTFIGTAPLVDENGIPTRTVGGPFLRALYNRSGGDDGIVPTVSDPLTATGTTLATALGLTHDWNWIGTVPAGSGVIISPLLKLQPGNDIWVYNATASNLNVYPPSGSIQIARLGNGAPYVQATHNVTQFQVWSSTQILVASTQSN